jgi:hypothetical protein
LDEERSKKEVWRGGGWKRGEGRKRNDVSGIGWNYN